MKRLGLESEVDDTVQNQDNCEGGVCTLPFETDVQTDATLDDAPETKDNTVVEEETQDIAAIAKSIADEFAVPTDIVMAAIYSSFSGEGDDMKVDEELARNIVRAEVDAISGVAEDSDEVCFAVLQTSLYAFDHLS